MPRPRSKNRDLPPRMQKKWRTYYYTPCINGKLKWIRLSDDFEEAKRLWAEYENEQAEGAIVKGTFTELANRYKRDVLPQKAKKTQQTQLTELYKLVAVFGKMRIKSIKSPHVAQYLDMSPKKTAANREVALLSHMFTKAIRWGLADINPCLGVERNKEKPRDRYITDEELMKLRECATQALRIMIDVAYLTGMRRQDIFSIKKLNDGKATAYLDIDGIYIEQKKTGHRQKFTYSKALRKVIDEALSISDERSNYLFTNSRGKKYTEGGFKSAWELIVKKSGVQDVHFHDIRAKSATDAKKLGVDHSKLLGHTSRRMSDRYVKLRFTDEVNPLNTELF